MMINELLCPTCGTKGKLALVYSMENEVFLATDRMKCHECDTPTTSHEVMFFNKIVKESQREKENRLQKTTTSG